MKPVQFRYYLSGLAAALAVLGAISIASLPARATGETETMIVEFEIKDYESWRPVFDAADPDRVKAGVTNPRVFRNADTPNRLLVMFDTASTEEGEAWMNSPVLRADWEKGGVIGTPTHRFLE